jgi:hypothetical protein
MNQQFELYNDFLKTGLDISRIHVPIEQNRDGYFPDFIKLKLDEFQNYVDSELDAKIKNVFNLSISSRIQQLSEIIKNTLDLYYEGKIQQASKKFFEITDILGNDNSLQPEQTEGENFQFYRARINKNKNYKSKDLFHVPFENRELISTNRYSIPGFPSLYLGDSTYVCWAEFEKHPFEDLVFSKIENKTKLTFMPILRIEDCLIDLEKITETNGKLPDFRTVGLLSYLITFPLVLACSVKVRIPNATFKPEYIIPQLLLEFVSQNDQIDGIKYLSTKVKYDDITGVKAYNYVFPVKNISKKGHCDSLKKNFHISKPTSWRTEQLINTGMTYLFNQDENGNAEIAIVEGIKSKYFDTAFGQLEMKLKPREISILE